MKKKILILSGGISKERLISLDTGNQVAKVLKKNGVFQRFTYMPEYKIWAHKICHVYKCVATIKKTKILENNHRSVFMNKKRAMDALLDTGFKYFVKTFN